MADKKITALPAGAALTGAELFESVQSAASVKVTAQQIANFILSGDCGNFAEINFSHGIITPDVAQPGLFRLTSDTALSGFKFFTAGGEKGNFAGNDGDGGVTCFAAGNLKMAAGGGGDLNLEAANVLNYNSVKLLDDVGFYDKLGVLFLNRNVGQQPAIADASVDLTDVVTQFNTLLAELRALELIDT